MMAVSPLLTITEMRVSLEACSSKKKKKKNSMQLIATQAARLGTENISPALEIRTVRCSSKAGSWD